VYDKILYEHNKEAAPENVHYMTPTKAALYGLMVRFRGYTNDETIVTDPWSLEHDPYGNRHRMPVKMKNEI